MLAQYANQSSIRKYHFFVVLLIVNAKATRFRDYYISELDYISEMNG